MAEPTARRVDRAADTTAEQRHRTGEERIAFMAALLGLTAVAIRLWLIWYAVPMPQVTENMRAGITLAQRGYIGDPFLTPTGPTAHLAPAYPALIGLAISIAGDVTRGFDFSRSLMAILFGAYLASLPRIAEAPRREGR